MFKISEPCHENWDAMTPSEQGRHCASCDKEVVDFTSMSETESEQLLREAAARSSSCQTGICGRVHADTSGTLQLGKRRRHRLLTDSMAAMLAVSMMSGCQQEEQQGEIHGPDAARAQTIEQPGEQPQQHPDGSQHLMGDICVVMPEPAPEPKPVLMGEVCEVPQEIEPVVMGLMAVEHELRPMPAQIDPPEEILTVKGKVQVIRGEIEARD